MDLLQVTRSANTLKRFVEGEGLYEALQTVGASELQAAQEVARHLRHARDRRATVNRILVHLESAHQHFLSIYARASNEILRAGLFARACRLDFETCCLMAVCHRYQNSGEVYLHEALFNAARARSAGLQRLPELEAGCTHSDFVARTVAYGSWQKAWSEVTTGMTLGDMYLRAMPAIMNPMTWVMLGRHVSGEIDAPDDLWYNTERFTAFIQALTQE